MPRKTDSQRLLDGNSTSPEWQAHPGQVCVAAVGAFEQHGRHLPLDTDNIGATYIARMIAGELGVPLLPTLPFGTSLEHSGFRGTVSLRPETLMQVVRDIAAEIERQGFRTLILVNGHGGNHCLTPVVRDINRLDGALKILLVASWEFGDPAVPRQSPDGGLSIHSDAFETSFMLAVAPDKVRRGAADRSPETGAAIPLRQMDLTTFGVGHFNPEGSIGTPSLGSRAAGRRRIKALRGRMMAYIRDRLQRLERQRRYAGSGGIALRRFDERDLPAAMRLKTVAGWNQLEDDWRILLRAAPDHCWAAVANGQIVGTATAMVYGADMAWIGMVLVDPAFRRMGIATRLLDQLHGGLSHIRAVRLDATPAGREVYQRIGYEEEYALTRMIHPLAAPAAPASPLRAAAMTRAQLAAAVALDRRVFGANRRMLLEALHRGAPELAWTVVRGGKLLAAAFSRPGANFHQVGPIVASAPDAARAAASAALAALRGRPVVIDIPDAQTEWRQWLLDQGFRAQRPFIRMRKGTGAIAGNPAQYYAIAGPEFG